MNEIVIRAEKEERVLRDDTDQAYGRGAYRYLLNHDIRTAYIHSDVASLDRIKIINDLRAGIYDVLVGVNLLREGIRPTRGFFWVAILDAD